MTALFVVLPLEYEPVTQTRALRLLLSKEMLEKLQAHTPRTPHDDDVRVCVCEREERERVCVCACVCVCVCLCVQARHLLWGVRWIVGWFAITHTHTHTYTHTLTHTNATTHAHTRTHTHNAHTHIHKTREHALCCRVVGWFAIGFECVCVRLCIEIHVRRVRFEFAHVPVCVLVGVVWRYANWKLCAYVRVYVCSCVCVCVLVWVLKVS